MPCNMWRRTMRRQIPGDSAGGAGRVKPAEVGPDKTYRGHPKGTSNITRCRHSSYRKG